jgi:hypothetical protein
MRRGAALAAPRGPTVAKALRPATISAVPFAKAMTPAPLRHQRQPRTKPAARPKSAPSRKGRAAIPRSRGRGARAGAMLRAAAAARRRRRGNGMTTPKTTHGLRRSWRP